MRGVFLLAGAITVWAFSALAAERISLAGYQDFKFGTPEADVRARINVIGELPDRAGGTWLSSAETVQVEGNPYTLDFRIRDGSLIQVSLSRSLAVSSPVCEKEFLNVVGLLQMKYGEADQPPDIVRFPDHSAGLVDFTFSDGGSISVIVVAKPQDCALQVGYISAVGNRKL
jgi:hypothetical protein